MEPIHRNQHRLPPSALTRPAARVDLPDPGAPQMPRTLRWADLQAIARVRSIGQTAVIDPPAGAAIVTSHPSLIRGAVYGVGFERPALTGGWASTIIRVPSGAVAQLGERSNRTAEVRGSTPLGSTKTTRTPTDPLVGVFLWWHPGISIGSPPMTEELFRADHYLQRCEAVVTGADDSGIRLDRTVFYVTAARQPGDTGVLTWPMGGPCGSSTRARTRRPAPSSYPRTWPGRTQGG